MIKERKWI